MDFLKAANRKYPWAVIGVAMTIIAFVISAISYARQLPPYYSSDATGEYSGFSTFPPRALSIDERLMRVQTTFRWASSPANGLGEVALFRNVLLGPTKEGGLGVFAAQNVPAWDLAQGINADKQEFNTKCLLFLPPRLALLATDPLVDFVWKDLHHDRFIAVALLTSLCAFQGSACLHFPAVRSLPGLEGSIFSISEEVLQALQGSSVGAAIKLRKEVLVNTTRDATQSILQYAAETFPPSHLINRAALFLSRPEVMQWGIYMAISRSMAVNTHIGGALVPLIDMANHRYASPAGEENSVVSLGQGDYEGVPQYIALCPSGGSQRGQEVFVNYRAGTKEDDAVEWFSDYGFVPALSELKSRTLLFRLFINDKDFITIKRPASVARHTASEALLRDEDLDPNVSSSFLHEAAALNYHSVTTLAAGSLQRLAIARQRFEDFGKKFVAAGDRGFAYYQRTLKMLLEQERQALELLKKSADGGNLAIFNGMLAADGDVDSQEEDELLNRK